MDAFHEDPRIPHDPAPKASANGDRGRGGVRVRPCRDVLEVFSGARIEDSAAGERADPIRTRFHAKTGFGAGDRAWYRGY